MSSSQKIAITGWLLAVLFLPIFQLKAEPELVARWQAKAIQLRLAQKPYWNKLLHYQEGSFQKRESAILSDHFFLSPQGKQDPEAELLATLKAFAEPRGDNPDQHPICRFVGRYHWLQKYLDLPEFSQKQCPKFYEWLDLQQISNLQLIFVSSYLDNPASLYGHILIKIQTKQRFKNHFLISPTINFGADFDPEDGALEYAARGIFGGYDGRFTDERFYNYNHVYGENELRDLWEYDLELTDEEKYRIVFHTWELLHDIKFGYYFFDENCAAYQAQLLSHIWEDETSAEEGRFPWVIPMDIVFSLQQKRNSLGHLILAAPKLIPSRQRVFFERSRALDVLERKWLERLIDGEVEPDSPEFIDLLSAQQLAILSAYLDWQKYSQLNQSGVVGQRRRVSILRRMAALKELELPEVHFKVAPPTSGTKPTRIRSALLSNSQGENVVEFGIWSSYHDALGDLRGHLPSAELVTLDLRFRYEGHELKLSQLELFSIEQLTAVPPYVPIENSLNWRANAGWYPRNIGCVAEETDIVLSQTDCLTFRWESGLGLAQSLSAEWITFGFAEIFLQTSRDQLDSTVGFLPTLGLTSRTLGDWQLRLEASRYLGLTGERFDNWRLQASQRLSLSQNTDVRLEWEAWEGTEIRLAGHWYF